MVALLALALLVQEAKTASGKQELTRDSYEKIRDQIKPSDAERAFTRLPWQPTLWEGVLEGQKQAKPILFYTMNGNPLGCT